MVEPVDWGGAMGFVHRNYETVHARTRHQLDYQIEKAMGRLTKYHYRQLERQRRIEPTEQYVIGGDPRPNIVQGAPTGGQRPPLGGDGDHAE